MNRKIIFLLIFIFSNNYSLFAQNSNATQSETEEWILQKLNNYIVEVDGRKLLNKENEFYDNFVKDISFDFNGCDLICTYKRIKDRSPLYGFIHGSMKFDVTIRIPVSNIARIGYGSIEMDSEVIETSYENVQQYSEDCNCWRSSSLENKYLRSFKITMSWQRETNLNNRMNEAFEHLKSFCTNKSNNREKF